MTDRNQFEAMLEALINEDQETAKEIFHNIVVAKSREIYEELLSEDFDLEEASKDKDDKDEDKEDKEDRADEAFGAEEGEEEEGEEEEGSDDVGGDATDDMIGDVTDGEEEDSEDLSDEEQTDRILDLEDALEELKAEFEQLMAGEEGEEHMGGDDMGMDAEPAMDGGMDDMGASEKPVDELQRFMEYVDKVTLPKHGDNGANTKSIVAGKNDMGGTTANIAKGGEAKGEGTNGGLASNKPQAMNTGNVNVPGGNAGKTAFKKKEPGHGAEKKGAGESADIKTSLIGSRK
jgi:hypothetical protein